MFQYRRHQRGLDPRRIDPAWQQMMDTGQFLALFTGQDFQMGAR